MSQQPATVRVRYAHLAKLRTINPWYSVMLGEPLIQVGVIAVEQGQQAAVLAKDALQQHLRLTAERLPQCVIEIGEDIGIWLDRLQIPQIEPLPAEVRDQFIGTRVLQHPPDLLPD